MIRYLISLLLFFAGINFGIFCCGGNMLTFVDVPSFIFVGIIPFLFVSILFGFRDMKAAFSAAFRKEIDDAALKKALVFFGSYGKIIWVTGVIGVIIGVIGMLMNLEDKSVLGPNMAVSIISVYYSCLAFVSIIIPFTVMIKKKLRE